MIYYVTSTRVPMSALIAYAHAFAGAVPGDLPTIHYLHTAPHEHEAEQGERILKRHEEQPGRPIIAVSLAELPLLRLLRRVGEGRLSPSDLTVIVLTTLDGSDEVTEVRLRVDARGEFLDVWPNGFFDARDAELFYEAP